jgi:hypothetical protein
MNRHHTYTVAILLFALALYLYFGLGWIAVVVYVVVLVAAWIVVAHYRRKEQEYTQTPPLTANDVLGKDYDALNLERRREQRERIISFSEAAQRDNLDLDRVVKRLDDWCLEYTNDNHLYHVDLYDFILERCKERLKSAKADYLKSELRLIIDIVRQFMRGRTVEQILADINKK